MQRRREQKEIIDEQSKMLLYLTPSIVIKRFACLLREDLQTSIRCNEHLHSIGVGWRRWHLWLLFREVGGVTWAATWKVGCGERRVPLKWTYWVGTFGSVQWC